MNRELNINGNAVVVQVEVNTRAKKTVSIEIRSRNRIKVKVPEGRDLDLDLLLEKYKSQIEKNYQSYLSIIPIYDNGSLLFNGKPRTIRTLLGAQNHITLDEEIITVEHQQDSDPNRVLRKWETEQTKAMIQDSTEKYPQLKTPLRVTVTDTKRWGYTRKGGVIVFNWQLSALPKELAEYVIVHELIHLEYPNHLNGFYTDLTKIIPDYKERIEQIKQYSSIKNSINLNYIGVNK